MLMEDYFRGFDGGEAGISGKAKTGFFRTVIEQVVKKIPS